MLERNAESPHLSNRSSEPIPSAHQDSASRSSTPDFSFQSTATSLDIPRENWEHPPVQEFVALYNQAQQLQQDLSIADVRHSVWLLSESRELQQQHQAETALDPSLSARYMSAEHLMRAVIHVLQAGFHGQPADPEYLANKINIAVGSFGLRVARDERP